MASNQLYCHACYYSYSPPSTSSSSGNITQLIHHHFQALPSTHAQLAFQQSSPLHHSPPPPPPPSTPPPPIPLRLKAKYQYRCPTPSCQKLLYKPNTPITQFASDTLAHLHLIPSSSSSPSSASASDSPRSIRVINKLPVPIKLRLQPITAAAATTDDDDPSMDTAQVQLFNLMTGSTHSYPIHSPPDTATDPSLAEEEGVEWEIGPGGVEGDEGDLFTLPPSFFSRPHSNHSDDEAVMLRVTQWFEQAGKSKHAQVQIDVTALLLA